MLVSSDVAVDSDGVAVIATLIGLISVAATDTAGVMIVNPPGRRFNTDDAETLGVTVEVAAANLIAFIDADTDGAVSTATLAAPKRTPAATETKGLTVMLAPRWISAHQPVTGKGGV